MTERERFEPWRASDGRILKISTRVSKIPASTTTMKYNPRGMRGKKGQHSPRRRRDREECGEMSKHTHDW